MLISLDWISDFVALPDLSPKELGEKFTLSTAEVEGIVTSGEAFSKIKVAEIISFEKHPEADKLNLVTFKVAANETRKVVCGASNVRVGLKTPYAPVGTLLPNGMLLEPKKIRGVLSEGMLCSEEELAFKERSEGIMELPANAPVGMDLKNYLKIKSDIVFNVDNKSLTHRPDLWGHFGMAREFATIFDQKLALKFSEDWKKKLISLIPGGTSPVVPEVDSHSCCLAYYTLSIDDVQVAPTPDGIKNRLESVGLRSINNIVDISNYVMLELGIPLHIFDRQKILGNTLFIKKADSDCTFITLDGIERKLLATDTIIADQSGPLVLAGIMGGQSSSVSNETSKILIEVANWKASEVRKTSTRLGLRTDSLLRYEKSLDSKMCERTLLRTLELVKELCPKACVVGKIEYSGPDLAKIPTVTLNISEQTICKRLGKEISEEKIISILRSLDFLVEKNADNLRVVVPSFRATKDISIQEDLVEEIGRIVGYDNITPVAPALKIFPAKLSETQKTHRKIRDFLTLHSRSFEIFTYPLVGENLLKKCAWFGDQFPSPPLLKNALSIDHDRMRTSLIPSVLESVVLNQKNFDGFRTFEIGRVYPQEKGSGPFVKESAQLIMAFYEKEGTGQFIETCNHLERLLLSLNVSYEFVSADDKFKNSVLPFFWQGIHPHEYLMLKIMGRLCGGIVSVHPLLLRSLKIRGQLALAVVDLSLFEAQALKDKSKFTSLSKFPESFFDCSVISSLDRSVDVAVSLLKAAKIKELKEIKVCDVFTLSNKQKSITLQCKFSGLEKTLAPDEIKILENKVIQVLDSNGLKLRQ